MNTPRSIHFPIQSILLFSHWQRLEVFNFLLNAFHFYRNQYPHGYSTSYSIHFIVFELTTSRCIQHPILSILFFSKWIPPGVFNFLFNPFYCFWIYYPYKYSNSYLIHFIFYEMNTPTANQSPIPSNLWFLNWLPIEVFKFLFNPFYFFRNDYP